ncbi:bactofilin family protein [Thalassobacter stenotrophicus]|uniref:Polymer-forming protein n=2 Tax=Thalassobacter stenotrophicus TaxID=266809 RepID=A0ABY1IEV2_9RHOB|nr:polymer-forming cytoskeletal protein [Thalassobacter stenotrophicus]CUH61556.1 putative acyltransferase [Thalassobacter stenotrophicus]SHJ07318.1 Polymer-forming protein [Thalassobacter stenotrophicus DSM 16310]
MADYKTSSSPSAPSQTERKRSIFADDLRIEGNITCEGILEFGGQLTGDLTADAVVLTPTARVKGSVRARQLTIEGKLEGDVTAMHVSIKTGARVMASVAYDRLDIASGAQVEGAYSRVDAGKFKL